MKSSKYTLITSAGYFANKTTKHGYPEFPLLFQHLRRILDMWNFKSGITTALRYDISQRFIITEAILKATVFFRSSDSWCLESRPSVVYTCVPSSHDERGKKALTYQIQQ